MALLRRFQVALVQFSKGTPYNEKSGVLLVTNVTLIASAWAAADHDITIINRRDGADAVVMSFDHYQSVMETLHLVSSYANAAKLAKAIAQDKAGKARARKLLTAA